MSTFGKEPWVWWHWGPMALMPRRQRPIALAVMLLCVGTVALVVRVCDACKQSALRRASWVGECVRVIDGETISVVKGGSERNVRLHCVDAPERSQPWAARAEQHLSALVLGRTVTIEARGYDLHRHRCVEANVALPDGTTANERQLRAGLARYDQRGAPGDNSLSTISYVARLDHRGVWAEAQTESVWD